MKYIRLTFQYLGAEYGKRLFFLSLIMLPGALSLAIALPAGKFVGCFASILNGSVEKFGVLILKMMTVSSWKALILLLASLIIIALSVSVAAKCIDRSMRVGLFKVRGVFRSVNENFIRSFITVLFMAVAVIVYTFFNGCFAAMWLAIFKNNTVAFILTVISALGLGFLLLILFTASLFTLPIMLTNGMSTVAALQLSLKQTAPANKKLALGILFVFLILLAFSFLSVLLSSSPVWRTVIDFLGYETAALTYTVFIYAAYYDVSGIERADLAAWERHRYKD